MDNDVEKSNLEPWYQSLTKFKQVQMLELISLQGENRSSTATD